VSTGKRVYDAAPGGERWIHEIKFDGYRVQLHMANDDIKVYTRKGQCYRYKKGEDRSVTSLARTPTKPAPATPSVHVGASEDSLRKGGAGPCT
jgi:ATP-dependent DNA ligase